jgi:hypothetical protein
VTVREAPAVDLSIRPTMPPADNGSRYPAPSQPLPEGEQTFPYNGGPSTPVPMPEVKPGPASTPNAKVPAEGIPVSLTPGAKKSGKWAYPAYGEQPRRQASTAR